MNIYHTDIAENAFQAEESAGTKACTSCSGNYKLLDMVSIRMLSIASKWITKKEYHEHMNINWFIISYDKSPKEGSSLFSGSML